MYLDPCKQYSTLILKFLKTHFYTDTLLNQIEFSYDPIEAIDVNVDSWICSENSTSVRLSQKVFRALPLVLQRLTPIIR